jgi:hypothetical protein
MRRAGWQKQGQYIGQLNSSPVLECLACMQQAAMWLRDPCTLLLCFHTWNSQPAWLVYPCRFKRKLLTHKIATWTPHRMACTSAGRIQISNRQLRTHEAGDAAALGGLRPLPQLVRSLQFLRCIVSVLLLPCTDFDCQASQQHLHPAPPLGMHIWIQGCPAGPHGAVRSLHPSDQYVSNSSMAHPDMTRCASLWA